MRASHSQQALAVSKPHPAFEVPQGAHAPTRSPVKGLLGVMSSQEGAMSATQRATGGELLLHGFSINFSFKLLVLDIFFPAV